MSKHDHSGELVAPVPVADILQQVRSLRAAYAEMVSHLAEQADDGDQSDETRTATTSSVAMRDVKKIETAVATLQCAIRSHVPSCSRLEIIGMLRREVAERHVVLRKMTQMTLSARNMAGSLVLEEGSSGGASAAPS